MLLFSESLMVLIVFLLLLIFGIHTIRRAILFKKKDKIILEPIIELKLFIFKIINGREKELLKRDEIIKQRNFNFFYQSKLLYGILTLILDMFLLFLIL